MSFFRHGLLAAALVTFAPACSSPDVDVFGGSGSGSGGGGSSSTSSIATGTGSGGAPATTGGTSTTTGATTSTSTTGSGGDCAGTPADDADGDGYAEIVGDCDDCDALVGPNAIEIFGNAVDEDCDAVLDNTLDTCDLGLALDAEDPIAAANAIDLCEKSASPLHWGLVSAAWTLANGAPPPAGQIAAFHLGHGVLDGFGPAVSPRVGDRLLALSNGAARDAGDPDYSAPTSGNDKGYTGVAPPGFPKEALDCTSMPMTGTIHDPVAVEIVIRVPANANGFSFYSDFYSSDWPGFVCSAYNDTFFAILSPVPAGQPDGSIAYYPNGNPVSLNGAPFDVCGCMAGPPCSAGGKTYACSQGEGALAGTGFETHGATGWQLTRAPAPAGGEVTLRLGVYDGADGVLAATALVDGFAWVTDPSVAVTTTASP